tara:strand:+ start:1137 stop:1298 length:162 start_codon:yes stop_codon:yes gene_type:complete
MPDLDELNAFIALSSKSERSTVYQNMQSERSRPPASFLERAFLSLLSTMRGKS